MSPLLILGILIVIGAGCYLASISKSEENSNSPMEPAPAMQDFVNPDLPPAPAFNPGSSAPVNVSEEITQRLQNLSSLRVQQKKEWGEILTGYETKNRYLVTNETGAELFFAAEETGFFMRQFLRNARPFTLNVMLPGNQQIVLKVKRPFRFYFFEITVQDMNGNVLGRVKKEFSFLRRIYTIFDAQNQPVLKLVGPVLKPWTFRILQNEQEIGKITKKWSGLGKEMFTDADNFGVTFAQGMDVNTKTVLLGAIFLIDFVHFERSK